MLNQTVILRYLEKKLGYRFNELEIDSDEILENIREDSLYTYSKYYPYTVRHTINCIEDRVEGYTNRYYLKTDYIVISPKRLLNSSNLTGYSNEIIGNYNYYHNSIFDAQVMSDLVSMITVPTTIQYFPEDNSLEIYPDTYTKGTVLVELNCVHLNDFSTIPLNMRDEFLKLCLYDTQEVIYHMRKRFSNLQTSFGNIELFIDDLQDAPSKKEELLERWKANYFKSPKRKKIYVG